jgi:hypothetical protein
MGNFPSICAAFWFCVQVEHWSNVENEKQATE